MPGPTTKTIKRLFATSGNRCAFPGCPLPLVNRAGDTVLGEVCHIKAQSTGGPRYDPEQTDDERHGFDNLLLLCPAHHKVVDDDAETYTVERLREIKAAHEARHAGGTEPGDDVARQFQVQVDMHGDQFSTSIETANIVHGGKGDIYIKEYHAAPQREPLHSYTPPPRPDPDILPDPGRLPPGFRIPFARNALFTGREAQLKALARALLHDEAPSTLVTQAVQGMGGIGKTQLAVEFAHRYGRFFHGVHWLDARLPQALDGELAACGEAMCLAHWPEERPEQVARTLAEWQQGGPRLVVLDNLEDVGAARAWLARLGGGPVRALLTARFADWPADLGLGVLKLDVFSPGESRAFLRRHLPEEKRATDEDLAALAERLGHLALALELAGRYLARSPSVTVERYQARLERIWDEPSMAAWREDLGSPTKHDLSLAATFALSWERVEDEAARRLFLLAGHCAPNRPIPRELLREAAGLEEEACNGALGLLGGLSLLELEGAGAAPMIHPLLAAYALGQAGAGDALSALADGLGILSYQANESGLPAAFAPLRPHVEAAALAAQDAGLKQAGMLWNNLGYHLRMVADYAGARAAYERALAIDEATYGPDHPNVAIRVNNLGLVLQDLGDLGQARAAFERALAIDEGVYGPDHPEVATDVNNLGLVLRDLGDLGQARAAFERALAIWREVYGDEHPHVATGHNNLGRVLRDLGDLGGARAAFERALRIDEAVYGPDHPEVATDVNNLGSVLQDLGDLEGARAAFERALAIDEGVYGPDHPEVATDVNNLGLVLRALGDLGQARAAFERALAIWREVYGDEHPQVATGHNNLGGVLRALGDLGQARAAFERALAIFERFLPPDHPHIQIVRRHLESLAE